MAAKLVTYHQEAVTDVKSAIAWYQQRSDKAALDFIQELHRAAETISQAPERWTIGKNNTRRFQLWRFPFTVIYLESESAVTILAVAHASRRPEYWEARLDKTPRP